LQEDTLGGEGLEEEWEAQGMFFSLFPSSLFSYALSLPFHLKIYQNKEGRWNLFGFTSLA